MNELNTYLVALSQSQSYNHDMNHDTINIILTILLLLPMLVIPIVGFIELVRDRRETNRVLFGSVHPDEQ